MTWDKRIIWCAGCGIEFTWGAVVSKGRIYCCKDCSEGKPCTCTESLELDTDIRENKTSLGIILS
jgi:hypothetical protein